MENDTEEEMGRQLIVYLVSVYLVSGLTFRYSSIKFQHVSLAFVAKVGKSNLTPDFHQIFKT